ncbi:MAG: chemotaxis protein CheB [Bacteroidetes bacterium]|nr:chemotaxis protein CheB [Bacteroidota bacterium]
MAKDRLSKKDTLLLIGGSAGSLEVLLKVVPKLSAQITFPIVIVVHRKDTSHSTLSELLSTRTKLPVKEAEDKDELLPGHIYIAPANYHLLFESDGTCSLDVSEKVNYSRPSIDVSFESAAAAFGSSVTAILLSGANSDGTNGLNTISGSGGTAIVQDPLTADVPFMPEHALRHVKTSLVLDVNGISVYINAMK